MKRRTEESSKVHSKRNAQPKQDLLSALPSDILRLVVAYIPFHPRIVVISLISKKLLRVARDTVTRLPYLHDGHTIDALAILPNITALDRLPGYLTISSLQALRSLGSSRPLLEPEYLSELSRLTSLHTSDFDFLLIHMNSSHLIELKLQLKLPPNSYPPSPSLQGVDFPAMTSFKLHCPFGQPVDVLRRFMLPLTQLTSFALLIPALRSVSGLVNLQLLPKLRHLSSTIHIVLELLPLCPNLASVHAFCITPEESLDVSRLAHLDVSVKLGASAHSEISMAVLTQLPRLSVLSTHASVEFSRFTSLTSLVGEYCTISGPMPKLEHVRFSAPEPRLAITRLGSVLQNCPHLRMVQLQCSIWTKKDMQAMLKLLGIAEYNGVEEFVFVYASTDRLGVLSELVRKHGRKFKWMKVHALHASALSS